MIKTMDDKNFVIVKFYSPTFITTKDEKTGEYSDDLISKSLVGGLCYSIKHRAISASFISKEDLKKFGFDREFMHKTLKERCSSKKAGAKNHRISDFRLYAFDETYNKIIKFLGEKFVYLMKDHFDAWVKENYFHQQVTTFIQSILYKMIRLGEDSIPNANFSRKPFRQRKVRTASSKKQTKKRVSTKTKLGSRKKETAKKSK